MAEKVLFNSDTYLDGHSDKITYQISNVKAKNITHIKMPLFEALVKYAKQDVTPFDVPGHKMGAQMTPFKLDVLLKNMQSNQPGVQVNKALSATEMKAIAAVRIYVPRDAAALAVGADAVGLLIARL